MSALQAIVRAGAEFYKQGLKVPLEIRVSNGTYALLEFELAEMVRSAVRSAGRSSAIAVHTIGGPITVLPETENE